MFAMSGCYSLTAGVVVSSRWFNPENRTTTTGIISMMNANGPVVAALVGPYVFNYYTQFYNQDQNYDGLHTQEW